ncbi:unnamed protein product [Mytilus edulis]|uniref:Death domain-containing protein n=1 Tax=Mytilus edulis TaxID=6550 RepID=A0A8S3QAH6_MYTED|nr:unnamed protein product [Mytilus edulis]
MGVAAEYELRCPVAAEWRLRGKQFYCGRNYVCLLRLPENTYQENCGGLDYSSSGSKLIFEPYFNKEECSFKRYQPFPFSTDGSSDCVFAKSLCNEEGDQLSQNDFAFLNMSCTQNGTVRSQENNSSSLKEQNFNDAKYLDNIVTIENFTNRIIGNWRFIKDNCDIDCLIARCLEKHVIDAEELKTFILDKWLSLSRRSDVFLSMVVRNIKEDFDFYRFEKLCHKESPDIAQKLKDPFQSIWIEDELTIEQQKNKIEQNKEHIQIYIFPRTCVYEFLESFVLSLDDWEKILELDTRQQKANYLLEQLIPTLHKGSYNVLKNVLENQPNCAGKELLKTKESTETIQGLIVSPGNESMNIPRASRNMLLKEIDIRTLLDGFSERKCNIFDSEKLSQIKTKKERTYEFVDILQGNNEYFDVLLEVLEQEKQDVCVKNA